MRRGRGERGYAVLPVVHVRARAPYRAWHTPPPRPRRAGVALEPGPMRGPHPRGTGVQSVVAAALAAALAALESRWNRAGIALESRWNRTGIALESRWNRAGIALESRPHPHPRRPRLTRSARRTRPPPARPRPTCARRDPCRTHPTSASPSSGASHMLENAASGARAFYAHRGASRPTT